MQQVLLDIVSTINSYLSNYMLIILLVAVGLYYTIRTRFVQVRCFGEGMKKVFGNFSLKGGKQKSGLSSFQALATAIAAQVGTGNIVGACGAILIGGPGAIFWMWIIAFFGMATIYSEAVLAQKTKVVHEDGSVSGGPVYYIKSVFKGGFGKFLAGFFAVAAVLALGFMGSMVQSNSIGESMNTAFGIPTWVVGIAVALISGLIFVGGIQRIGAVTEKIVPVMAILYIVGGLVILGVNYDHILETFGMIFKYAFNANAIIGGGIGAAIYAAISQGAKRGLFSNEAGMGSTPHAHALANVKDPHDQGVVAMIGVFIDTFVVLTFTALIVISTLFTGGGPLDPATFAEGTFLEGAAELAGLGKTNLAQVAFGTVFGEQLGNIFVAICLFFFAFSTIISWNLFGKINFEHLFGKKAVIIYSIVSIAFIFTGAILKNDLVWELTDMFNYLMVLPNVIALFALGGVVSKVAKKHIGKNKKALAEPEKE
ncbi:MAG: sodium:alanine symporter family protein [Ruminococcaceae bacterium]|nr:sodium:alanine symporter family protein [Oscillospiraceae bacterium]